MENSGLKVIFSEILRGYTLVENKDFGKIKIKHFNNFDSAELDIKNRYFYEKARDQGLPTREQKIEYLLKEDIWDEKKNKEILNLKTMIAGLKNSKSKVFLQAHIDDINRQLEENQLKLAHLEIQKEELIGFCAENYAQRRINEHYMQKAILKDNGEFLLSKEDFEDLQQDELMGLISTYNKNTRKFESPNLKKISLSGFFTNLFYLCENNAYTFFGKPLVELTFYQVELFGYARYYKSLVEWFESSKSAREVMDKSQTAGKEGSATSLVGATKQDLKRLGLDNPNETISLAKKAAEKGGSLTMQDMMKIHGV